MRKLLPGRYVGQTRVSDVGSWVFREGPTRWRRTAQTSPAPPITGRRPLKSGSKLIYIWKMWSSVGMSFVFFWPQTGFWLFVMYRVNSWSCWVWMSRGSIVVLTHFVGEIPNALKPFRFIYFRFVSSGLTLWHQSFSYKSSFDYRKSSTIYAMNVTTAAGKTVLICSTDMTLFFICVIIDWFM